MIKNIELEKAAYDFKAKMPLRQAIPLGLHFRVYAEELSYVRQHPLTLRRYMWKLEY